MKNLLFSTLMFIACSKPKTDVIVDDAFKTYVIKTGEHYCENNELRQIQISKMNFTAVFDSSAVYQTLDPANQNDINKLLGFSEGFNHHANSARIGWSYNNDSLRLYAYVYCDSVRYTRQITTAGLFEPIDCSIAVASLQYHFSVLDKSVTLPRAFSSPAVNGFQLYPYFGGDETAPQSIFIRIKTE